MTAAKKVWTVLSMLNWATSYFENKSVSSPRLSIEWLLAEVLQVKRLNLYLQYDRPLSSGELEELRPLIKRRAEHEPLQYITGFTDFLNCRINLNSNVLIPRIETEQLVEILLEQTKELEDKNLNLLDIGTGSGCIPIAIKKERPGLNCFGVDISEAALEVAEKNATLNNTDVTFFKGSLFDHNSMSKEKWDIIISNPPYISPDEKPGIEKQVIKYEPELALFHEDPLSVYESVLKFSSENKAFLFLECNHKTANRVSEIAGHYYSSVSLLNDLDNNPRFIITNRAK